MNFFKGTGVNGLKAIKPKKQQMIRPLLFAFKEEILAYLEQRKLAYREDSSNADSKYTRNYFRNELIPAIEKVFPQVRQNLFNNIRRFDDISSIYQRYVSDVRKKLVEEKGSDWHIPVLKLKKTIALRTVLFELIKEKGFGSHQVEEVMKLLEADSGKHLQSDTHRILKNRNWLIISPLEAASSDFRLIEPDEPGVEFQGRIFQLKQVDGLKQISKDPGIAQLNLSKISFPLILRKWKQGDYFYPLGMSKKKKLSRFMTDAKLSLQQKERLLVLESGGRIVWLVGHRIDDRFKIKNTQSPALVVSCQ
jgi:tRNA(Ile)-lysidine synthase